MQEETNSILYQRQNGWSKKSVHTLKLPSKCMQQIKKCHSFHVYVVVEIVETLEVGWCPCIYVCTCVFVWCPLLRYGFIPWSVWEGGVVVSLYDTHEAEPFRPG